MITRYTGRDLSEHVWLSHDARLNGLHIVGTSGCGKSRLAGRGIVMADTLLGTPSFVLSPSKGVIEEYLDAFARCDDRTKAYIFSHLLYIDMAGRNDNIIPLSIYARHSPKERLVHIARRFVDTVLSIDEQLINAPISGRNAFTEIASHTGIVLAALGLGIVHAKDLLNDPQGDLWKQRLQVARQRYPEEMEDTYSFFTKEYPKWNQGLKDQKTAIFRTKIDDIILDPTTRAIFGGVAFGIDFQKVVDTNTTVLIRFPDDVDETTLRFEMMWLFRNILSFMYRRGQGRSKPVSIVIDEFSTMCKFISPDFVKQMDKVITGTARNYGIYLTVIHQDMSQFDESMQDTLMRIHSHIIGATNNPNTTRFYADYFFQYDPLWQRRETHKWMADHLNYPFEPYIIDSDPVEFSIEAV